MDRRYIRLKRNLRNRKILMIMIISCLIFKGKNVKNSLKNLKKKEKGGKKRVIFKHNLMKNLRTMIGCLIFMNKLRNTNSYR